MAGELRFKCLKCGRCCSSEVIISYADVRLLMEDERLATIFKSSFKPRRVMGRAVYTTNSLVGADKRNPCVFLRKDNTCSIYSLRPKICRVYPFGIIRKRENMRYDTVLMEKRDKTGEVYQLVVIDPSCPGIGKGNIVDLEALFHLAFEEYMDHVKTYASDSSDIPAGAENLVD